MHGIKDSFTETHKIFPVHYGLWGGEGVLKFIETHLYCTKYNEIKMIHSIVQNHVSCRVSHKRFLI